MAGPGYAREWALFCDYAAATGQPALPTTVATLAGFFTAVPARPATLGRRVRAIAAAHRHAGHLLLRPDTGPAAPPASRPARAAGADPGEMIGACATRGWPYGLHGRRDAFLVVTTHVVGLPHDRTRALVPPDVRFAADPVPGALGADTLASDGVLLADWLVPVDTDPRRCPVCAVVRWLDILGTLDGLGRGSARMHLTAAHAPTNADPHHHTVPGPPRWRAAATLLPAIDRHGWLDDYRPITTRTIRTRLALTTDRTTHPARHDTPAPPAAQNQVPHPPRTAPETRTPSLDEVLGLLDGVADDADALNDRITALLNDHLGPP
ncbi:hypothetical protein DMP17_44265 [Pseudonocardia sp. TMWB2A]